jgi:hypothetical protein
MDYLDAALCAVTAEKFRQGCTLAFGAKEEGYIVVPKPTGV